jgi:hypothetical protein
MRWLLRSPKQSTALVEASDDIGLTQSAQVDTGSVQDSTDPQQGDDQSIPIEIEGEVPLNFGALRSPQEHAAKLVERMRAQGSVVYGRSFHQGELEDFHWRICKELRWLWRKWPSVGRELKKLPGVRKGKVWFDGQRLTVYEIGPAPAEAIVDLAEEKLRKRA